MHLLKRPLPWLIVILLLAGPALAVIPVASAQLTGIRSQTESLLPDAKNAVQVATDPAGDTEFWPLGQAGENRLDGTTDIVSLSLAETEDRFLISVEHRDYDALSNNLQSGHFFGWYYCWLRFQVNSDDRWHYASSIWIDTDGPDDMEFMADGYMVERDGDRGEGTYFGMLPVALVDDHVEIVFDKTVMRVGEDGRPLRVGDKLTDFDLGCYRYTIFFENRDRMEGAGEGSGVYKVTLAGGTDAVTATYVDEDGDSTNRGLTLPAGTSKKAPVLLKNLKDSKLIVNLTARVVDADGKTAPGWKAIAAPNMEVPGAGEQQATVVVTPPEDAAHRASATLVVEVRPLGGTGSVQVKRPLFVSIAPTPEDNVLKFHSNPYVRYCSGICISGTDYMPIETAPVQFVMNLLDDDPVFGNEATEPHPLRMTGFWYDMMAFLDVPLSKALRIDESGTYVLTLGATTEVERPLVFHARLMVGYDDALLAEGSTETTVGASGTVELKMTPNANTLDVEAGDRMALFVRVEEVNPVPKTIFTSGTGPSIKWDPAASNLALPLLPIDEDAFDLTDGSALPTVQLRNGTEREAYVNPEKPFSYDLRLVNEGVKSDKLTIQATGNDPAWGLRIEPGTRFALDPGRAAPFSVLVTAPAGVEEGAVLIINLTATSDNDDRVSTTFTLRAIATDLQVDEKGYTPPPPEEHVDPLDDEERTSPAPVAPLMVVGVLGLAAVGRRRK
ncbi:MAG: hypothetical protein KY455_07375 [Euryarchaeota archaeon]|nr:hypothetical protein [Euryarchaeota archaeon]